MKIYSAPLQGYTSAIWRKFHNEIFGGIDKYYSPFLRIDRGELRKKDLSDINPENNKGVDLIPQIIATTPQKAEQMLNAIIEMGYSEVDVNFGCPFPPIANKHQGSGILQYPDEVKSLLEALQPFSSKIKFSFKSRLGYNSADEIIELLPLINQFKPIHLAIHPRIGKQQYKGELDMATFERIYNLSEIPIVYNGDIRTVDDISRIKNAYPNLDGIMIGRGLLHNPALAREFNNGKPLSMGEYMILHNNIYEYGKEHYCGATQILSHIKPLWEYAPDVVSRQVLKAIKKSGTLAKYENAISMIQI